MTRDEAVEYFEENIVGAYAGEGIPVFIHLVDKEWVKSAKKKLGRKQSVSRKRQAKGKRAKRK